MPYSFTFTERFQRSFTNLSKQEQLLVEKKLMLFAALQKPLRALRLQGFSPKLHGRIDCLFYLG